MGSIGTDRQPNMPAVGGRYWGAVVVNVVPTKQPCQHRGRRGCLGGSKWMLLLEDGINQQVKAFGHLRKNDGAGLVLRAAMPQPQAARVDGGVAGNVLQDVFGFGHGS